MTTTVNIHEAKTHLSKLLEKVGEGHDVIIAKAGKPVARLVAIQDSSKPVLGSERGKFVIPEDFDAPDPELEALFDGRAE
jgi:prevent-host-death family protein